ncbi:MULTISPECIES: TauD/TfdA family dioxygenase [unclassified Streptomyces]|uniref:TauD/TfdA family dioxygenase n=1 Tax=unclassified Streptomyces TaxID=2593676 RepID=UPI0009A06708|nr:MULTISPECIES: TauD/TfdA family dioxygenase [unclassified Streptomyces]
MALAVREKHVAQPALRLTRDEAGTLWELSEKSAGLLDPPHSSDLSEFLPDVPAHLRDALVDFREGTASSGYLLVKGVATGDIPDTPLAYGTRALVGHASNGTLALVGDVLGSLIGYADEKNGDLLHDVHPVRGEEHRMENSGSVAFDFHTENVHHPLRPDFLGLLSLRQGHEATATRVASIRHAVAHLSEDENAVLRRLRFRSLFPTSFTRGLTGERPATAEHRVLFGDPGYEFLRFDSFNTKPADLEAERALGALAEALEAVCVEVVLEPGDLLLVNNHIAAHGRSAFTPRYDGRDRWLRRFYSHRAVPGWARLMMPSKRVLPATGDIQGIF